MRDRLHRLAWAGFSRLPLSYRRKILYRRRIGRSLSTPPASFTEKIQWRIVNDRRELISRGGDKLAMKLHVQIAAPSVLIPETLWFGEELRSIYHHDFKGEWVLKPITGSGHLEFGRGSMFESGIDLNRVKEWDPESIYRSHGEWAYSQARPGYLIERRIPTANGEPPNDYRFFVFDGTTRLIQVDTPRFNTVKRRFYTPEWSPLDVRQGGKELASVVPAPAALQEMLRAAETIGAPYDFMRVDLYESMDEIYFGELTPYPTGGLAAFDDYQFDLLVGSYWTLPNITRKPRRRK